VFLTAVLVEIQESLGGKSRKGVQLNQGTASSFCFYEHISQGKHDDEQIHHTSLVDSEAVVHCYTTHWQY